MVGSSNRFGRASIIEYYQAVIKLAGNRSLFECQQCRSVAELFSAGAICRFKRIVQLRRRVVRRDVAVLVAQQRLPDFERHMQHAADAPTCGSTLQHRMNSPES